MIDDIVNEFGISHDLAHKILIFIAVMIFNTISFIFCYFIINDISVVDICWGVMFLISTYALIAEKIFVTVEPPEFTQVQGLTLFFVSMWALRLIAHLAARYNGKEDWRYTKVIRERW